MEERRSRVSTLPARAEYEEEVSLAEYVAVLWRYRFVLLGVVLLAVAATLLVDWNRAPVYQATSRLMLSASKIGDTPQSVSIGTYQAMVNSQTIVAETLDELGLSKPPHTLSAPQAIQNNLAVQAIPDANVIQVTARFGDPALAAQFANRLADKAVELARRTSQEDTVKARDTIKLQLDESRDRLQAAERNLETFQKKAKVEALEADVDAMMKERGRLLPLLVEIQAERARVRQLSEELSKQEPVRNVPSVTVPANSISKPGEREARPLNLREDARSPFVNPVYEQLQQQLSDSRTKLTALEREHAAIARATNVSDAAGKRVQELYSSKAELDRLQMEKDLARKVYLEVSNQYEQSRLLVASRSAQLQVIDKAVPSSVPVSPRIVRDTVGAAAGSLILASAVILLLAALGTHPPRR